MDHDAFVRMILEPVDLEESSPEPLLLVDVLDEDAPKAPPLPPKPLRAQEEIEDEADKVHLV